jgi:hypothetical protein
MSEGTRTKIKNKAEATAPANLNAADLFGGGLKIPDHIKAELDKKGLVPRFVSLKVLQDNGGYHPKGWTPYTVENPQVNPITGTAEKTFRIGDLVLAVKTKEQHAKHKEYLSQRSAAQSQEHKNNVKEMRDKIRDSGAGKHISLIEGYEENDGTDED